MLSSRQKEIIDILTNKRWIKGKVIASQLDVTTRTIRSDIEKINTIIPDLIESNTRKGYCIQPNKMQAVKLESPSSIPQSPTDRVYYIIQRLLINKDVLSIDEIKDSLFVSSYTIESDIRKIRDIIKPFSGLELVRRNNQIFFQGSEFAKRKLYRNLLNHEVQDDFLNINKIAKLYESFDLMEVFQILTHVLKDYDYQVRKTAVPMLVIHIGISIERMLSGYYIEQVNFLEDIHNAYEYKIAQDFYSRITHIIPIDVKEEETLTLAGLLLGYKNATLLNDEVLVRGKKHNIPELISEVNLYLKRVFDIDFSQDQEFVNGLQLHIQSYIERASRNITIPNVHLQDIKKSYPLFFEMSLHVSKVIGDALGLPFSEPETGFIALHLGSAYERYEANRRYRVILLTAGNDSFVTQAKQKLENLFGDRMEIISIVDYYTEDISEYDIDLLISLVSQVKVKDIMSVTVSTFMTNKDVAKILLVLNELDKEKHRSILLKKLPKIISDDLFYINFKAKTVNTAIGELSDDLYQKGFVNENFEDSVLKREAMVPTSFEQGLALPHPLTLHSSQSKISVALLDEPILWGKYEVKIVMLLAISEQDRHILWSFFEWLSEYITNAEHVENLRKTQSADEFINLILEV